MKSLTKRILLFIAATPSVGALTLYLTFGNHLILNFLMIIATVYCSMEAVRFFRARNMCGRLVLAPVLAGVLPAAAYLVVIGFLPSFMLELVLIAGAIILLSREIFIQDEKKFEAILPRAAVSLAILIYPGYFFTFLVRIAVFNDAGYILLLFFIMIFLNDAAAYLFGMLFGNRKETVTAVSPNKTKIGFAAGFGTSIAVAVLIKTMLPMIFTKPYYIMVIIGAAIGISCIFGDLIESALKRSASVKDSGTIIPGRGGVLDSLDSLLFAAPVFYYLVKTLLI